MTVLWSDTFTDTDGAAWPGRWVSDGPSPNTPDISSNQGRQRTGSTAFSTYTRSVASGELAVVDAEVLVKLTFDNPKKSEWMVVAVRQSGGWSGTFPAVGYFVELAINSNNYTFRKRVSGSTTTLATVSKTFTAGTAVWVRLQAWGSAIKAKVWDDGSSEPGWDSEQTDTGITGTGHVGLSTQSGVGSVCTALWDSLEVSDANASIPLSVVAVAASVPTPTIQTGAGVALEAIAARVVVPFTAFAFHQLTDDFNTAIGSAWVSGTGVTWVDDGGGTGHVEIDEDTTRRELYTAGHYRLANSHVSTETVFPTANAPVHAMQLAPVQGDTGTDYVSWVRVNATDLKAVMKSGGATIAEATLAYSSTTHKYLKISERRGTVTWWTSPDGQAWTARLTADTAPWGAGMTQLYLTFYAVTFATDLGQVVRIDSINGNGNTAVEVSAIASIASVPTPTLQTGAGATPAAIAAPAAIPAVVVHTTSATRDRIVDPFDGPDGSVTTHGRTGANWDAVTGSGSITSNQVTGGSSAAFDVFRSVDEFPIDDMYAQVEVTTLSATQDRSASVALRMAASAATYYLIELNELADRYTVSRVVNGTGVNISGGFVPLASPLTLANGAAVLGASVQGNRIQVYLDGDEIGDYTDIGIPEGKRVGFGFYNSGGVSRLNNFSAYHLGNAQVSLSALAVVATVPTPAAAAGGLSGIPGLIARWTAESLGLANGASVSTWAPSAGAQSAALTAAGTQRPTYATNQQNSLPAVRFTRASSQYMDTGAWSASYPVPLTVFCVFKFASLTAWMNLYTGRSLAYAHASANPTRLVAGAGSSGTMAEPTALDTARYHAVGVVFDGASSKVFYDSLTATATGTTGTTSAAALPGLKLGTTSESSGAWLDGWIAEVIVVSRAMADADVAGVMGALAIRYDLPWAPDDPGPTTPPPAGGTGGQDALPAPALSAVVPTPHYGAVFDAGPTSVITLPLQGLGGYVDFEVPSIANLPGFVAHANTTLAVSATLPLVRTKSLTMTRNAGTGDVGWTLGGFVTFKADNREYVLWFPVRPGTGASNRVVQIDVEWLTTGLAHLDSDTATQTEGTGYVSKEGYTWVGLRTVAPAGTGAIRWYVTVKNVPAGETHHLDAWTMRYFGVNVTSRLKGRREERGRADDLATFEAGKGHIVLKNDDGAFTPGGSGYPVDLRNQVTLVWEWDGKLYPGFVGYAENWENNPLGNGLADVVCTFNDYFEIFSGQSLYPPYQMMTLRPSMGAQLIPAAAFRPPRAYFPMGESSGARACGSIAGRGGSGKLVTASAGTGGTAFGADSFQDVLASGHSSDGDITCIQFNPDITSGKGDALDVSAVPGVFPLPGKSWSIVLQVTIPNTVQSQIFYRSAVTGSTDKLSGFQIEAFSDGKLRVVTFSDSPLSTSIAYDTGGRYIVTVTYDHTVGTWGKIRLRAFGSDVSKTLAGNPFANGTPTLGYLGGAFLPINSTITFPFQGKMAHVSFWDGVVPDALVDVLELTEVAGINVDDVLAAYVACGMVGFPTEYVRADAGLTNLLPLHWETGAKPLELMRAFARWAGGHVLMSPDGRLSRHNRLRRADPIKRFTFSGTATGARRTGLSSKIDRPRLANSVDVSRVGGGSYRFVDEASADKYGEITAGSFEFPIDSEDEVAAYGAAVVATRSVPKPETQAVEFALAGKPDLIAQILQVDVGDFIEVGDLPDTAASSTVSGFVEKIESWSDSPLLNFKARLALSPAGTQLVYGEIPDVTPPPPVAVPPTPPPPTVPPSPNGFWQSGGSANTNVQSASDAWGSWRSRPVTLCLCYNTRGSGWGSFMPNTGQPAAYSKNTYRLVLQTSPFPTNIGASYSALIAGSYDSQWTQFGTILKQRDEAVGRLPTIVSIAWEMNGTYMPWGYGTAPGKYSSAAQYKQAFQRISNLLRAAYPNIKIAWVTNGHTNPVPALDLYPGDAYLDYLGTDYYDHYPSAPNAAAFDAEGHKVNAGIWWYLQMARDHGKPLIVPEWGVAPGSTGGNTTGDNPIFVTKMYEVFVNAHSTGHLAGEVYFDDSMGGGNVDSDLINGGNPRSAAEYLRLY